MSRRITFTSVVESNIREKAIQPQMDDLVRRLLEAMVADWESQSDKDHEEMTVFHVTATKEVRKAGETESSEVDHRRYTLAIFNNLPQSTAICKEVIAEGGTAARPKESDQRLVKLVTVILKRIDKLLFDSFLVELMKESGKEVGKRLVTLASILIALAIYFYFYR